MYMSNTHEQSMISLYNSFSEKDRRRYAGIEALKLGCGGITYISGLFNCDDKTISKGIKELNDTEAMKQDSIRISGGGRKQTIDKTDGINDIFLSVVKEHTAGDPMKEGVKWTNLSKADIIKQMAKNGIRISKNIVKKLLRKNKFVKRKALKKTATKQVLNRDEQFKKITKARNEYDDSDNPIISIDTKKVEKIGNLYRDGTLECIETIVVYDHDFPELAYGKIIPYTIFDMKNNEAFVYIGTTFDTSELACDAIKCWWNTLGKKRYPNATSILGLADGGGSNASNSDLFKADLQRISNDIQLDLRICHYPPGTSKWNPIEHRVFPHITRALSGVILKSIDLAQELIGNASTSTGLKVFTKVSKKIYEKGKKVSENFYDYAQIVHDEVLGKWNYMVFHTA